MKSFDQLSVYSYDEVLSGMTGNVDQDQLDNQLKYFKKYARILHTKPQRMIFYKCNDDDLDVLPENFLVMSKRLDDDVKIFQQERYSVIQEKFNNLYWLYFANQQQMVEYFKDVQKIFDMWYNG